MDSLKIWLVGGSQGIGLALTEELLSKGHQLVVSSRKAESSHELLALQQRFPQRLFLIDLDVTDGKQTENVIHFVNNHLQGIDLWIYNAGAYSPMDMENWNFDQFAEINDINYLGAVRLMVALKDTFLQQGYGRWLWNISLAADFGLPYGGAYSAPKAALMNLAESIQPELAQKNIQLQIINHGFVKTRLTAKNDFPMLGLMDATTAARHIVKIISNNRFESRFPWNLSSVLWLLRKLPKSWSLALTRKMLRKPHE